MVEVNELSEEGCARDAGQATVFSESDLLSRNILIVDDQPANALLLELVLDSADYSNYRSITDPRDFLRSCRTHQPDLVLLDLHMPHFDGYALMEQLREELPPQTYLPIVVITGDQSSDTRVKALAAGATNFLTKPLNATEVVHRIGNLLRTRCLYSELQQYNKVLQSQEADRAQRLADAQARILARLARVADDREDGTGEHADRVGELSAQIARALQLPEEYVEVLRLAATLHDVGKMGIPNDLLMKPGRLTAEEYAEVKAHARIGAAILGNSAFPVLQTAGEIALSHHERWDGQGYPAGLLGREIPLAGRIVAVADVFDALVHDRPYKRAWPVSQAIAELKRLRGSHLDPDCVDAFLEAVAAQGTEILVGAGSRQ